MKRSMFGTFIATAISVGLAFGFAIPKAAHATSLYEVYLHPAASNLTCGWHTGACYDDDAEVQSGWALDWNYGSNYSFTVNWISKSDNSGGYSWAGNGFISYYGSGTCTHITTIVMKDRGGSEKNRTQYVHTSSGLGSASFYVSSGYYPQTTTAEIGATADESGGGCSWSGYHSHIESLSGWDSKRSYPDHTTCNLPNIPDDCEYFDNYTYPMYRDAWTYLVRRASKGSLSGNVPKRGWAPCLPPCLRGDRSARVGGLTRGGHRPVGSGNSGRVSCCQVETTRDLTALVVLD